MLDDLTPVQAFELVYYQAIEPFGEVGADRRMSRLLQFYYDSKRGKRGQPMTLEDFSLYSNEDPVDDVDPSSHEAFLRAMRNG